MTLPSPDTFVAESGIAEKLGVPPKGGTSGGNGSLPAKIAGGVIQVPGVSTEFRALLADYCAAGIQWKSLGDVNWGALAQRLGSEPGFLAEAAAYVDQHLIEKGIDGGLWTEVLAQRIKKAGAARVFRDSNWERLEALAIGKLVTLAENNMIRDPGELLAVASAARRVNVGMESNGGGGNNVTVNIGAQDMTQDGLPAAGAKMTIDLSPRMASALQSRGGGVAPQGSRVIDGDMLSAKELRGMLEKQDANPAEETEDGQIESQADL